MKGLKKDIKAMERQPEFSSCFRELMKEGTAAYEGLGFMIYNLRTLVKIADNYNVDTELKPLLYTVEASRQLLIDMAKEVGLGDMVKKNKDGADWFLHHQEVMENYDPFEDDGEDDYFENDDE